MREREIPRNAGEEDIESLRRLARAREKGCKLELADLEPYPALGEIGLHELLDGVVTAADRQQLDVESRAGSRAPATGVARPAGRVEQRISAQGIEHRLRGERERTVGRDRARGRHAVA